MHVIIYNISVHKSHKLIDYHFLSEVQNKADILSLVQIQKDAASEKRPCVESARCGSVSCTRTSVIVKSSPKPVTQLLFSPITPETPSRAESEDLQSESQLEKSFFDELISNLDEFYPSLERLAPHAGDQCIPIKLPVLQYPASDHFKDFIDLQLDDTKEDEKEDGDNGFLYPDKNLMWANYETPEKRRCYPETCSGPDSACPAWGGERPTGRGRHRLGPVEDLAGDGAEVERFEKNVVEDVLGDPPDQALDSSLTFDSQTELSDILFDCNILL